MVGTPRSTAEIRAARDPVLCRLYKIVKDTLELATVSVRQQRDSDDKLSDLLDASTQVKRILAGLARTYARNGPRWQQKQQRRRQAAEHDAPRVRPTVPPPARVGPPRPPNARPANVRHPKPSPPARAVPPPARTAPPPPPPPARGPPPLARGPPPPARAPPPPALTAPLPVPVLAPPDPRPVATAPEPQAAPVPTLAEAAPLPPRAPTTPYPPPPTARRRKRVKAPSIESRKFDVQVALHNDNVYLMHEGKVFVLDAEDVPSTIYNSLFCSSKDQRLPLRTESVTKQAMTEAAVEPPDAVPRRDARVVCTTRDWHLEDQTCNIKVYFVAPFVSPKTPGVKRFISLLRVAEATEAAALAQAATRDSTRAEMEGALALVDLHREARREDKIAARTVAAA